jgi:hypothetical protein
LSELGEVFTKQDLLFRFGTSHESASVMLSRWHRRDGWVRPLGGRSEVYFNLVKDPYWQAHFELALKLAVPHAITIGQSAYSHGWISQLPNARHLAVPHTSQLYTVEGCQFHFRRREWFVAIAPGVQYKQHTIPELLPSWALADALLAKGAYRFGRLKAPTIHSVVPDPDELYADNCTDKDVNLFSDAVESLKNIYGFITLSVGRSGLNMRQLYSAVHGQVLCSPQQEFVASPGL